MMDFDEPPFVFSVSEITREIKFTLENAFDPLWVQGELSNFVHHRSGHMYFSLKDTNAQISCVMWKSRNQTLSFLPQDGMRIKAYGQVRVYERRGNYQLDCMRILPAGIGDLQFAFEQLKQKLDQEGLFDPAHKKALPALPIRIGVITSATGAAIHDIHHVLYRRFPLAEIILRPALVQGEGAAADIAAGIEDLNAYGGIDVLIVGRGGGSLEDLWVFNEERVARAIYASDIPVVSAVGHEIDFTISDLRAPTPSAAAEMIVPDAKEIQSTLGTQQQHMLRQLRQKLDTAADRVHAIAGRYAFQKPVHVIRQHQQRIDDLDRALSVAMQHRHVVLSSRIAHIKQRILDLHPQSVLRRGYCICWDEHKNKAVQSGKTLSPDQKIRLQFYKDAARAHIDSRLPDQSIIEFLEDYDEQKKDT